MKKYCLQAIKLVIPFLFTLLLCAPLGAQNNLLYDGDFEDSQFECNPNENLNLSINVASNNWFAPTLGGISIFFGIWDTTCNMMTMDFLDPFTPPYQGDFSGWIFKQFLTNSNGTYIPANATICTNQFTLEINTKYYISLVARRDKNRGNPLFDYSTFEMVFTADYFEKIVPSHRPTYSPKDTTHQSFYFNKDTIDFDLGFVKLDTCFILNQDYNALCFRFDDTEYSPELISLIHETVPIPFKAKAYWIDVVEILDAKEVPGNPCKVEDHPENIANVVLELPNIFTPNNDGVNDAFIPIEQENISLERIVIQNRWGQTVYEGKEINWDGTINKQPASEGVYYYVVSYRNPKGEVKSKSGTVTLKR